LLNKNLKQRNQETENNSLTVDIICGISA